MDFEKKFDFINRKLENLMAFGEISSLAYITISNELLRVEDNWGLTNVMDMIEVAVLEYRDKKDREKREREERKEERRKAK